MRVLFKWVKALMAVALLAGTPVCAQTLVAGKDFQLITPPQPTPPGKNVEVIEFFWYGCPHCFHFDPMLEAWRAKKPEYVNFIRIPAVWNPLLQLHARAFYTAEALGKGAEMHSEFFKEIHERHNGLDTEQKLQEFFGRFGVDAKAFKTAFDSFAVHAKLQRADELNRRYRIGGVPTLIIWGEDDDALGTELNRGIDDLVRDVRVVRLPGCSHWSQQDDYEGFNRAMLDFFQVVQ